MLPDTMKHACNTKRNTRNSIDSLELVYKKNMRRWVSLLPNPLACAWVTSRKISTQVSGNIYQLYGTSNSDKTLKTGKKQYICGACAGHAHLSVIQRDVERFASNLRIRIFIIYGEK